MNRIDRIEHNPLALEEVARELRAMLLETGGFEPGVAYSVAMRVCDQKRADALMMSIWHEHHPGTSPPLDSVEFI
jgi:hypothetical protein